MAKYEELTVGNLRRLIQDLPDDAMIFPDWYGFFPGDDDPVVRLTGIAVVPADGESPTYLSIGVAVEPLNNDSDDEGQSIDEDAQPDEFDHLDDDDYEELRKAGVVYYERNSPKEDGE